MNDKSSTVDVVVVLLFMKGGSFYLPQIKKEEGKNYETI
jgi:hypothetical protein